MRSIIIIVLLIISSSCNAQGWQWARNASCNSVVGYQEGWAACIDENGFVYMAGSFAGSNVAFGTVNVLNQFVNTADIFLVKFDTLGNPMWIKKAGGAGDEYVTGISYDHRDGIYISGTSNSTTIMFGPDTITNFGSASMLFKFDTLGNAKWARIGEGIWADQTNGVANDRDGNVFMIGLFSSDTQFFGNNVYVVNPGTFLNTIYLVKYDSSGTALAARTFGGNNTGLVPESITIDNSDKIYVVGMISGNSIVPMDNDTLGSPYGGYFLSRFDVNLQEVWSRCNPDTCSSLLNGVAVDSAGNVFVTGMFYGGTLTMGSFSFVQAQFVGQAVFAKYDKVGNVLWAKSTTGNSNSNGWFAAADSVGNCYFSGGFTDFLTVDSVTLAQVPDSADPGYIIKFDPYGNILCYESLPSGGDDQMGMITDRNSQVYVAGDIYHIDTLILGVDTLIRDGGENAFLAKYGCNNFTSSQTLPLNTNAPQIVLFPNPCNHQVTITPKGLTLPEKYLLIDASGRIQTSINCTTLETVIDVSSFENGIYFVGANCAGTWLYTKLVKAD